MKKGVTDQILGMPISVIVVAAVVVLSILLFFKFGPAMLNWASELTSSIRDSLFSIF